jgi:hypothetical protein
MGNETVIAQILLKSGAAGSSLFMMNGINGTKAARLWAPQGWLGLALLVVCWPLNWTLPGMRTAYLFFPLWLGYILVVDVLVLGRTGSSLWHRARWQFALLFVVSAPVWWIFEAINSRTANWEYLGSDQFTVLEYYLLCTLCFSTVMPAVFETAELVRSFRWMDRFASGPRLGSAEALPLPGAAMTEEAKAACDSRPMVIRTLLCPRTGTLRRSGPVAGAQTLHLGLFLGGLVMLALTLLWPRYFYPLVWISLVCILDPLNRWLGRPHLLADLDRGDWRPVASLSLGALICGFFWEMWNYHSYPKWIYHTPGAQFLRVFEMPLLGYGGYIPFALELFALKSFLWPGGPRLRL